MNSGKHIFIKIISLVIVAVMLMCSLSACNGDVSTKIKIKSLTENKAEYSLHDYHVTENKNLVYVAKSGLIELYYDSVTSAVAIKETSTGKYWYSLPQTSEGDQTAQTSVVNVKVSKDDQVYYLNSQDNSVAFSTASFKPTNNGIQVTYDMALNAETALKSYESLAADELYVSVTAIFSLSDGTFTAKINCGDMIVSDGFAVESVDFMNYFGASTKAEADDFIFVPDASGALIMTGGTANDIYETRNYKVYGDDISMKSYQKPTNESTGTEITETNALVPAFGIKNSSSALLGLIVAGDTIASISASRYNGNGTYNRVGASFRITDTTYSGDEGKRTKYIGQAYSGEINICYRCLSNKNASYVGLASACREMLIRNSVLSSDTLTTSMHIPFMLTVQGAVSKKNASSYTKLSTYDQTLELLNLMKAKSINNIDIRYCGMLDGANNQIIISKAEPIGSLGNKKEFEKLSQYASTQKFEMYLDMSLVSFSKRSSSVSKNAAQNMAGDEIAFNRYNQLQDYVDNKTIDNSSNANTKTYVMGLSKLGDSVLSFMNNVNGYAVDGYCINDAGSMLYSDYSDEAHNRNNAVNMLTAQVSTLANNHKIMVENGNFYMLKNANAVVNLPDTTGYPQTDSYVQVPFVQIILHGIVDYSMEPINLADDPGTAFLKSVEYGAMPSYEWICTKLDDTTISTKYYYENQLAQAAENYKISDETIGNLRNARMTAHYKIQDGVYCTEYNNSIIIYFNYNSTAVTVNSVSVAPMSCLRVN